MRAAASVVAARAIVVLPRVGATPPVCGGETVAAGPFVGWTIAPQLGGRVWPGAALAARAGGATVPASAGLAIAWVPLPEGNLAGPMGSATGWSLTLTDEPSCIEPASMTQVLPTLAMKGLHCASACWVGQPRLGQMLPAAFGPRKATAKEAWLPFQNTSSHQRCGVFTLSWFACSACAMIQRRSWSWPSALKCLSQAKGTDFGGSVDADAR